MIGYIPNVTSTYSAVTFDSNFMSTFPMCPIFYHWVHCDYISGRHLKCIQLVTLGSHSRGHSKCAQPFPTGHIGVRYWVNIHNVPNFWLLGTLWSSVVCDHNVFSMYPLGIYPLVPSGSGWGPTTPPTTVRSQSHRPDCQISQKTASQTKS